jgi:hypothetical protein
MILLLPSVSKYLFPSSLFLCVYIRFIGVIVFYKNKGMLYILLLVSTAFFQGIKFFLCICIITALNQIL